MLFTYWSGSHSSVLFCCKDTATTEIYSYGHTLSLHDALPICAQVLDQAVAEGAVELQPVAVRPQAAVAQQVARVLMGERSEEHTSELQSLMRISYAVFCLKKKRNTHPLRV